MSSTTAARPSATATIEPVGRRTKDPRDHAITVVINPSAGHADRGHLADIVRSSFEGFAPTGGEPDRRKFGDASSPGSTSKAGDAALGVQGSVVIPGKPSADSVERMRNALFDKGFRVTIRERRECRNSGCANDAMVPWNRASDVPPGWHSNHICGKHNYRTCTGCASVYLLTSTNFVGQAPSVPCQVCGGVIVAWGGSKMWNAKLVKSGEASG